MGQSGGGPFVQLLLNSGTYPSKGKICLVSARACACQEAAFRLLGYSKGLRLMCVVGPLEDITEVVCYGDDWGSLEGNFNSWIT